MRFERGNPGWLAKFACAGRGLWRTARTQSSFKIHILAAGVVAIAAATLRTSAIETSLLLLCVTGAMAAELFNTAIERLARAITAERDRRIRDALDMASAAVLVWAIGASGVGLLIFGRRFAIWAGWWTDG